MGADFIPDNQFTPDSPAPAAQGAPSGSSDFIPDSSFVSDEDKYGTPGQKILAAGEGVAKGFLGPVASLIQGSPTARSIVNAIVPPPLRLLTDQYNPSSEDVRLREETNPWTHGISEAAGFGAGLFTGTGEAALLEHATAPIAGAVTQAITKGAAQSGLEHIGARLAAGAAKSAAEMGLFQAGDEASKAILQDPNQTVGSAAANIGLSALLGGVTGGLFTGAGLATKSAMDSKFLQDFRERMAFRGSDLSSPELVEKQFHDAMETYHGMNDELLGPAGTQAKAYGVLMPERVTPQISSQVQDLASRGEETIKQLIKDDVPDRYIKKLQKNVNALLEATTEPGATAGQHFDAINDFKKTLQGYSKGNYGPFSVPSYHEAYDFINATKSLGHDARIALENPEVWGKVADIQKEVNSSWQTALPAVKDAQKRFMDNVAGEITPSSQKFSSYLSQNGKKTSATVRQKSMGKFVSAMDKHFDAVEKVYQHAGIENPFPRPSMEALQSSLDNATHGSKIADLLYDRMGSEAIGHAAGAGVGATVLPGIEGAYLGKEILGPVFGSLIQPLLEKGVNNKAFQAVMSYGKAALKGDSEMTNAAARVFGTEAKTIPSHIFPEEKQIEKLDKRLKEVAANPTSLMDGASDVAHYFPGHGQALTQTAMGAVNYLNSQRPSNPKTGVLDTEIPVSKTQEAVFHRTLTIAQQPLSVIQHIKDGTLLPQDMQTLNAVYPALYQQMSQKLMSAMTDHVSDGNTVPYRLRQSLSLFLGQPLDSTMTPQSIQSIQSVFAKGAPARQAQNDASGNVKKGTSKLGKLASNLQTPNQARDAHRMES